MRCSKSAAAKSTVETVHIFIADDPVGDGDVRKRSIALLPKSILAQNRYQ